jgi:uncharacterized protein (DUF58 family)
MLTALQQKIQRWISPSRIEHDTVVLTQRRVYILPTRQGLILCVLLVLMLLGDINYSLSLGYILTFLLAMMAVMSMLHTFRNLAHLEIRAGQANPVFSGETACFKLHFYSKQPRYQLILGNSSTKSVSTNLISGQNDVFFMLPAPIRGWLQTGRLTLYTEFPLGLFHAWSYLYFDMRCLVYPKPMPVAALPMGYVPDGTGMHNITGDDDFAGLRNYTAGDAMPRIAWKAYAKAQVLHVKQFANVVGEEIILDFANTPDPDPEEKLSRLTRQILDAEASGLRYGLRLPSGELLPENGPAHQDECLRRLALFGLNENK